jgi:hypothetical protein
MVEEERMMHNVGEGYPFLGVDNEELPKEIF